MLLFTSYTALIGLYPTKMKAIDVPGDTFIYAFGEEYGVIKDNVTDIIATNDKRVMHMYNKRPQTGFFHFRDARPF